PSAAVALTSPWANCTRATWALASVDSADDTSSARAASRRKRNVAVLMTSRSSAEVAAHRDQRLRAVEIRERYVRPVIHIRKLRRDRPQLAGLVGEAQAEVALMVLAPLEEAG